MHHTESYPTLPQGQFENKMPMHILEKCFFRIAKIGIDGNHKVCSLTRSKSGSTSHDFLLSFTKWHLACHPKIAHRDSMPLRGATAPDHGLVATSCHAWKSLWKACKPFVVLRHWCLGRTGGSHRAMKSFAESMSQTHTEQSQGT